MLTVMDKNNLQQLLNRYSFSNIMPPPEVYKQQIPQSEHFIEASATKRIRRIFYKVTFSNEEYQKIYEVKRNLIKNNIPQSFYSEISILKHLYETDMNTDESWKRLTNCYNFLKNPAVTSFTQLTKQHLQRGYIYSYGRDRNMKPLCIVQIENYPCEKSPEEVFNCVYYLMLVVLGVQAVPYHAEKYTLVIDFSAFKVGSLFSYWNLLEVFKQMVVYYSGNVERTVIYNATGFQKVWYFIKGFIPQFARKRIHFVSTGNIEEVTEFIDPSQLERKFGGTLPNLEEYWPPRMPESNKQNSYMGKVDMRMTGEESDDYYSIRNDISFFQLEGNEGEAMCGKNKCDCSLF